MNPELWVVSATVVTVAVLAVLVGLLARASRRRRGLEASLAQSRGELAVVRRRLDALAHQRAPQPVGRPAVVAQPEYVITTAGTAPQDDVPATGVPAGQVSGRQFASVAVGESLVRLVSLAYGVRRALSAENRNRIGFEVRREVRRARKRRRREEKQGRRYLREAA
jgi:hypothetical protein